MNQYEYHVHFFEKCMVESKDFQKRLNALGGEGWKLKSLQWLPKSLEVNEHCEHENCYELVFIREKAKD
mgnify:CR=1 FL=1|tara:strand:- start:1199 stop:1405 length:207 start_codon:yes stop_codon:yes gene_type:complete